MSNFKYAIINPAVLQIETSFYFVIPALTKSLKFRTADENNNNNALVTFCSTRLYKLETKLSAPTICELRTKLYVGPVAISAFVVIALSFFCAV